MQKEWSSENQFSVSLRIEAHAWKLEETKKKMIKKIENNENKELGL